MKKTKKLVCFLLTCLLLCSMFMLPASAQEQQPDEAALLQAFKGYLDAQGIKYMDPSMPEVETVVADFLTYSGDWAVFLGFYGPIMPMPTSDRIGNYVFYSDNWYEPYQIGLFAEKDGVVLTLKEAYEAGEIDIDSIASYTQTYLPGDTDMDGEITVEDVLTVQKVAAKRIDMEPYYASFNLCDYTGDQVINVQDVLAMQKYIAKVA